MKDMKKNPQQLTETLPQAIQFEFNLRINKHEVLKVKCYIKDIRKKINVFNKLVDSRYPHR